MALLSTESEIDIEYELGIKMMIANMTIKILFIRFGHT